MSVYDIDASKSVDRDLAKTFKRDAKNTLMTMQDAGNNSYILNNRKVSLAAFNYKFRVKEQKIAIS